MLSIQKLLTSVAFTIGLGSLYAACSPGEDSLDPQETCDRLLSLVQGGPLSDGPLDPINPSTVLTWNQDGPACELQIAKVIGETNAKIPEVPGATGSWHKRNVLFDAEGPCSRFDWSCAADGALLATTPKTRLTFRLGSNHFAVDVTYPGGKATDLQPE